MAPWLPAANLFDWSTCDRVEQFVWKREINLGEGHPLGVYPTLSTLKTCFFPGPPKGDSKIPHKEPPLKDYTGRKRTDSNLPLPCMAFPVNAKTLIWEGMTTVHQLACAGMRDRSMEKWIVATKDIGTQLP